MSNQTPPSPATPEAVISAEQRTETRKGISRLLGINALSFAFSVFNELVVGHSALGFTQATMEATDSGLAKGLHISEANDAHGRHRRASRQRQALYATHIVTASAGIAEGARMMRENAEPSMQNVVISGLVGVLNGHFLYHRRRHSAHLAHTSTPTIDMAFSDPLEVAQDVAMQYPSAEAVHQMNDNGTTAITYTNLAEAGGGIVGVAAQYGWEQGSATAAIVSSLAVVGIMGRQIQRERSLAIPQDETQEPYCITDAV